MVPKTRSIATTILWVLCLSIFVCNPLATAAASPQRQTDHEAHGKIIDAVSISPSFFNPSLGQTEQIRFIVGSAGRIAISILDRDRFLIRSLPPMEVNPGPVSVKWDGKDDQDTVVPDESYSIRIEFQGRAGRETYDPSLHHMPISEDPPSRVYSRADGVLGYTLSRPSRVHIEAGEAVKNEKTGEWEGPILKTIVDRQPKIAGTISEKWNGYDEGGTIYVPDLKHFVVSILATSLSENSIITVGNRRQNFLEYALKRRPPEANRHRMLRAAAHKHHTGLNAFEDHSPALAATPDATWDPSNRIWKAGPRLVVTAEIKKPFASFFLSQPGKLLVFCDEKTIRKIRRPSSPQSLVIDLKDMPAGEHRLIFNWVSEYGPVAVNSIRVRVGEETPSSSASVEPVPRRMKDGGRS